MNRFYTLIASIVIIALALLMHSCKKDNYLSDDERSALFATPTTAEIDSVYSQWQQRDLTPTDYTVVQQEEILGGKFTLKILSYKVTNIKEYAALLIPDTNVQLPVRMYVGGFGLGITENSVNMVLDTAGIQNSFVFAIPALRGQSLKIILNGVAYTSPVSEGNHCDAFDGGTDDVLAFLNLIEQTELNADVNRTSVRGGSRGGTVALLAGIRDSRIKRVVSVAGPANMHQLTSVSENDPTYQCQFLSAFKDGQLTLAEARNKMIESSPYYFAQHLPLTQLHMGIKDDKVPVQQGYDLNTKMIQLGNGSNFQLFTYDRTHEDIAINNPELVARIELFLSQL